MSLAAGPSEQYSEPVRTGVVRLPAHNNEVSGKEAQGRREAGESKPGHRRS